MQTPKYDALAQNLLDVRRFFQTPAEEATDADLVHAARALGRLGIIKEDGALNELEASLYERMDEQVKFMLEQHHTTPDVIGIGRFEAAALNLDNGAKVYLKAGEFPIRRMDYDHYLAPIVNPKPKPRTKR